MLDLLRDDLLEAPSIFSLIACVDEILVGEGVDALFVEGQFNKFERQSVLQHICTNASAVIIIGLSHDLPTSEMST